VNAAIIAVDANTYEVSYLFNPEEFPRTGGDIQDFFIFKWNSDSRIQN